MGVHDDIGPTCQVAKLRHLSLDRGHATLEYRSGLAAQVTFGDPDHGHEVGDVVFVRYEDCGLEPAPAELWPTERGVGVVRLRQEDKTVIDVGGRWRLVPTQDVAYAVDNTVEFTDEGVARVLAEEPIRLIDLPDRTIDIADFKYVPDDSGERFEDFGGFADVVARARELVEVPLQHRTALEKIGAPAIKGVLFTGPTGTGKTMLARIIANEANATFYPISGPSILQKYFGESEGLLRRIFDDAAQQTRSIIFFDEIDSVAVRRTEDAHEASMRVVAQLLTLMDGFERTGNVIVIAATNRAEAIDDALRRPGRFDWEIEFRPPHAADRLDILERSGSGIATAGMLPHALVAAHAEGWSAADLTAIWSEAALLAAVDEREVIVVEDYVGGFQRVAQQRRRAVTQQREPVT